MQPRYAMRPVSAPADGPAVRRSSSSTTFDAVHQFRSTAAADKSSVEAKQGPAKKRKDKNLTEAEKAYRNYQKTQRRLSLRKWALPPESDDDDAGSASASEDEKPDEAPPSLSITAVTNPAGSFLGRNASLQKLPAAAPTPAAALVVVVEPSRQAANGGMSGTNLRRPLGAPAVRPNSAKLENPVVASTNSAAPAAVEKPREKDLSASEAARALQREIKSRETIISLLLQPDESGPSLGTSLSAATFVATVRPFTAGSAIMRSSKGKDGGLLASRPSSAPHAAAAAPAAAPAADTSPAPAPSSVSFQAETTRANNSSIVTDAFASATFGGQQSMMAAKRELTDSLFAQANAKRLQAGKPLGLLTPQLKNAWRCDSNENSDDESFDRTLPKSTSTTLAMFHHRPVSTRFAAVLGAAVEKDVQLEPPVSPPELEFPLPTSAQKYVRPATAPPTTLRCSPLALAKARNSVQQQRNRSPPPVEPLTIKQALQTMLSKQAVELSALEEQQVKYKVQTEAYLNRQRDLQRVIGAIVQAVLA